MLRSHRVFARHHETGMAIYVTDGTQEKFVMTHRTNSRLYFYLCDNGRRLEEVRRYRPGNNKGQQRLNRSLRYVVKVVDYVLNCEDAA